MISGPSSFPPTIAEFYQHWQAANAAVPDAPLVLPGGTEVSTLEIRGDELEELRDAVTDARVDRALARQQLNAAVALLQGRVVEFNRRVRADFAGSAYERTLPEAFALGDGEAAVRDTLRHVARLWLKLNAITPAPSGVEIPVLLLGGYTLAMFNTAREALRGLYRALGDAEVDLKLARERRNDMQEVIYPILKAYRLKLPTVLPAGHALLDSLPVLTPPDGHTPAPVVAQAVWDATAEKAKITWAASPEPTLQEYEVRGVPGDDYETEDEVVLATIPAGGTREFLTAFALAVPEVTAGFKVYVVLTTDNERGSEAVFVTRPG